MKKCPHCGQYDFNSYEVSEFKGIQKLLPATSREVYIDGKISVSNASNRLTKWWRAGYLDREALADDTGGIIFRYSLKKEIKQ